MWGGNGNAKDGERGNRRALGVPAKQQNPGGSVAAPGEAEISFWEAEAKAGGSLGLPRL